MLSRHIHCKIINKAIETNKLNHGGIHSSSLDETKDKYRKTISKRTFEDWQLIKEHTRITLSEKYHGDYVNPSQVPEIKMKIQDTCEKRYGSREYFSSKDKLEKTIRTCQEKYGVDNYSSTEECRKKVINTCIERYGGNSPSCSKHVLDKMRQTCLVRYGVEYYTQTYEYHQKAHKKYVNDKYPIVSFGSSWEFLIYDFLVENHIEFEYQPSIRFEYEYDGKIHTYHPDFLINGKVYEVKGNQFFRINETTGQEEMYCPYRYDDCSDDEYEFECGKYEAKHQCMLSNNVIILREHDIDNLTVDMFN